MRLERSKFWLVCMHAHGVRMDLCSDRSGVNGTCYVSVVWELARGVLQLTLLSLQGKWAPGAYLWGLIPLVAPFVLCVICVLLKVSER